VLKVDSQYTRGGITNGAALQQGDRDWSEANEGHRQRLFWRDGSRSTRTAGTFNRSTSWADPAREGRHAEPEIAGHAGLMAKPSWRDLETGHTSKLR